jgi:hypothetical protein
MIEKEEFESKLKDLIFNEDINNQRLGYELTKALGWSTEDFIKFLLNKFKHYYDEDFLPNDSVCTRNDIHFLNTRIALIRNYNFLDYKNYRMFIYIDNIMIELIESDNHLQENKVIKQISKLIKVKLDE